MGSSQQFSLRWNNYVRHITSAFESLRSDPEFVDVTLSCEGKKIKAHKMLLSACSSYFKDLFKENPCPHPVVVFRNVSFVDLEALIDFMYQGEVNVVQEQLASFLTTAELLAVQGLTDGTDRDITEILDEENMQTTPVPPAGTISERKRGSSSTSSSFTAPNPRPISPSAKRRKWSASSNNQNARNESGSNETSRVSETSLSASNSVQIPSTSQVKIEMPEFLDTDTDPVVYDNPESEGINPLEETGLEHGGSRKEESIDIYGGNSSDTGEHLTMSEADLNQVLAKAGPSSEGSQDSLQVMMKPDPADVPAVLASLLGTPWPLVGHDDETTASGFQEAASPEASSTTRSFEAVSLPFLLPADCPPPSPNADADPLSKVPPGSPTTVDADPLSKVPPGSPAAAAPSSAPAPRSYACDRCGKVYRYMTALRNHKINGWACKRAPTSSSDQDADAAVRSRGLAARVYVCRKCGKVYRYKRALRNHKAAGCGVAKVSDTRPGPPAQQRTAIGLRGGPVRPVRPVRPYPCSKCGKVYRYVTALRSHKVYGCK